MRLAQLDLAVSFTGSCQSLPVIEVSQARDAGTDTDPFYVAIALTFDRRTDDAINALIRRTAARVMFEGKPLVFSRMGDVVYGATMETGDFRTLDFQTIGELFAMPTIEVPAGPLPPCPAAPTLQPAGRSPMAWGNKRVEAYFGFANLLELREVKAFRGWTFQKSNQNDVGISSKFSCVDESLLYSKVPLCYELQPFSGKRRGEIVKDLAAIIGIDPATVTVPLGGIVNKPVVLSSASLMPFLKDFGAPENWVAYFDENGLLVVEQIEVKDIPDWTLDASKGDYIYDSFSETMPQNPPTRYYVTGSQVVQNGGPGDNDEETSVVTEELDELYAEETVKVRPSGASSYLYGDGSYRARPSQILMPVAIAKTFTTKRNGIPIRNRTERYQFYNPNSRDPNFDSLPAGTSYDGAYGNKTFHRDEVEGLILFSEDITDSVIDDYGTLISQVQTSKGWFSPQHALNFFYPTSHRDPVSAVGVAYMYPGSIMRLDPVEQYGVTQKITTNYSYGDDGTLSEKIEITEQWFSPQSRCDIVAVYPPAPDPTNPPPPIVTPQNPPPPPVVPPPAPPPPAPVPIPPVKTVWQPVISGPRQVGLRFFFDVDFSSAPQLDAVTGTWQTTQASVLIHGDGSGTGLLHWTDEAGPFFAFDSAQTFGDSLPKKGTLHFDLTSNTRGYVGGGNNTKVDFGGSIRPKGFLWASIRVQATVSSGPQAGQVMSAELRFDPWATIPQPPVPPVLPLGTSA